MTIDRHHAASRIFQTFLGELEEQIRALNAAALALESMPDDPERLRVAFRIAHTLKGAARAAGVSLIEEVCHDLESLLAGARDRDISLSAEHFRHMFAVADGLADAAVRLKAGQDLSGSALEALGSSTPTTDSIERPRSPAAVVRSGVPQEPQDGQVRVPAAKLDALLNAGSEMALVQGRVLTRSSELKRLHERAAQLRTLWRRFSYRARAVDRAGAASAPADVAAVGAEIEGLTRDMGMLAEQVERDTRELRKTAGEVQQRLRALRMRPFVEACEALPRVVRDLAAATDKKVELLLSGGEVEADRAVLDGLRDAILQLVRNAVDHGIEKPSVRRRRGKLELGTVSVSASLRGDRIVVMVADDGAGFDVEALRKVLKKRGDVVPETDQDVVRALLASGGSTREHAGAVSGRGVGLDIVRESVRRIRGMLDVSWQPGQGSRFVIECPPSLVSVRVLLVAAGSQSLAIPCTHVERLLRVEARNVHVVEGRPVLADSAGPVPLVSLTSLLGWPELEAPPPWPVVLVRSGDRRVAAIADGLVDEKEIMLRPIGASGRGNPLLVGGALLDAGHVALVVDPEALITTGLSRSGRDSVILAKESAVKSVRQRILVVDDSITTRTLEQSILEAAGYEVFTAVNGEDAWRVLQEKECDLVVADVEMPGMDGFELCKAIRGSKRHARLPVVLVTAMESDEYRSRGLEAGADAYIGKSTFDQEHLLETIRQLISNP